ncbi:hypothetical protein [Mucilaginibacter auburnensis]|uniref:Uncharacterized protein n=1 Tax=Mucilaginibacter auburnensis TaxID=1457233 RepID=A0A2H9VLS4_9SPHI|nr:hypothetical protein [Mucilaginibacter auburnensis]PJJ79274.1 hypothetical protein CLV57_2403 [Mucilaginibacter auburnensis]
MNEPFVLQVNEHAFKARFERWGYTHRFMVLIGEETFTFEPDEEGSYRALGNVSSGNVPLLQTVAEKLAELSK